MIITLLTDFGTQDPFAGVLKGVIKTITPAAEIVDLTHHVPPQDVAAGAFALKTACRYFPAGTIHLAIVDPGVGGARHPIAARIGDAYYVCPDNGLLSSVLAADVLHQAVVLDNPEFHLGKISRTFHGRDIFAPVAAHLARGVPLAALGTPLESLQTLPLSRPEVTEAGIVGHILYCDVYGNLFTDIEETDAGAGDWVVAAGGRQIPGISESYSAVTVGEPLAVFGSSGHLEIAVRNGSARARLGLKVGDTVTLRRRQENRGFGANKGAS